MKPFGHHKKGHNTHPHNICGICSGQAPQTHSAGRAWHKEEMQRELDVELSHVLCECEECEPEKYEVETVNTFLWRDRLGFSHSVYNMDTRYLMNVFLMVYNNIAESKNRVGRYNLYSFPAVYTVEYMVEAIGSCYDQLNQRKLLDWQTEYLEEIEAHLFNNDGIESITDTYARNQLEAHNEYQVTKTIDTF